MNPQLSRELVALVRSPQLLFGMACFTGQIAPEARQILSDGLTHLERSSAGRQILTLFGIARLVPFEASQLEGVHGLVRERATLLARSGG
jgi:hypothetical protein